MKYCYVDSPIGSLLVAGDEEAIHLIAFDISIALILFPMLRGNLWIER